MSHCSLLSGFAQLLVQGVLLVASLSALWIKHLWEKHSGRSNRSTARFFFDCSKQLCGAAWMHVLNLLCAGMLAGQTREDPCQWYWIEIMVDTTLGVYVEFCVMQFIVGAKHWHWEAMEGLVDIIQEGCLDESKRGPEGSTPGPATPMNEGENEDADPIKDALDRVNWPRYIAQVIVWLVVVTIMKVMMLTIMGVLGPQLLFLAETVLHPFKFSPILELLFVMILTPVVMDVVQFFLQDNIFMDLDEGRLVELPPQRTPVKKPGRTSVLQDIKAANEQAAQLNRDNDELRLEIAALRAELKFQRSGFVTRIILVSFQRAHQDQSGLYRATADLQTYQRAELPKQTYPEVVHPGKVVCVEEVKFNTDPALTWAKIQKPVDLADHWIILATGKRRYAKRLVGVEDAMGPSASTA